jgi:LAS superfamily LD-carboxypeptidase LdcB
VAVGLIAVFLLTVAFLGSRASQSLQRADPCTHPPTLTTRGNVTLRPDAMRAYRKAQKLARGAIEVGSSYRTCSQQALTCQRLCGNPEGCAGTCVKPGYSYHQLGAAIDISQASLDTPGVIHALQEAGWCQSVPDSDPGHFSFGGCH